MTAVVVMPQDVTSLADDSILMLKAHLDQQDAECTYQHSVRPPDTLFCRPSGVPWSPDTVTHYFKRMANSVGIILSLKHLWHTQASILLQKGVH